MDSFIHLIAFVRAVEARNFTEAGQQFSMCTSAIGRAIARLTDRHGARLFHRSNRSSVFTHVGVLSRSCLRLSRRVEASITTLRAAAKD
jgi:DNA-binding transcriptional LysR family regulator